MEGETTTETAASRGGCPSCGGGLEKAVVARFQTLEEHVIRPNAIPPKRQSYWCSDPRCETRHDGEVWLGTGEGPYQVSWLAEAPDDC